MKIGYYFTKTDKSPGNILCDFTEEYVSELLVRPPPPPMKNSNSPSIQTFPGETKDDITSPKAEVMSCLNIWNV